MKNLDLSISNPCAENWSGFTSTHHGAFCGTCSKEVIDFTKMSDTEIVAHFSKSTTETCGRFQSHQLRIYQSLTQPTINPGFKLLKAGLLVVMIGLVGQPAFANPERENSTRPEIHQVIGMNAEHIIKGVIQSEEGESMPGVNIYLKNGKEGTVSDAEGKFEFPRKLKAGEVLVFSFMGYEKVEYVVSDEPVGLIEITMVFDSAIILGKVAVDEVYAHEPQGFQKLWLKIKNVF